MYVILGRTGNRISKGEYLVGNAVLWLVVAVLMFCMISIYQQLETMSYFYLIYALIAIPAFFLWITMTINRLHDLGKKWAYIWLLLIPLLNIYRFLTIMFKSGDREKNIYGENTLVSQPVSNMLYWIIWVIAYILAYYINSISMQDMALLTQYDMSFTPEEMEALQKAWEEEMGENMIVEDTSGTVSDTDVESVITE